VTLDLEKLVEEEGTNNSLANVRNDLYQATQDYIAHLRRERDEHDNPHSPEAKQLDDKFKTAKTNFDRLRAKRQKKINRAVFSPGKVTPDTKRAFTETERDYVEMIAEADEMLREISGGESLGEPVMEAERDSIGKTEQEDGPQETVEVQNEIEADGSGEQTSGEVRDVGTVTVDMDGEGGDGGVEEFL
jgi:DNA replication initiation complex subunit (GINS family)